MDSNLRGIQHHTGDEPVEPVDRCDKQDHIQSRRPEHCMAKERCLHLCGWPITCRQCYGTLILHIYSWRSSTMYAASFHPRLFHRLSQRGLDSDLISSTTGVDTVHNPREVSTGSYSGGALTVTKVDPALLRHRNVHSDRERRGDRPTSTLSCDLFFSFPTSPRPLSFCVWFVSLSRFISKVVGYNYYFPNFDNVLYMITI